MTANTTAVLNFAIYMSNAWDKTEAIKIFGENIGEHIFNKWVGYASDRGPTYASLALVYDLDSNNLEKLVERACKLYDGRRRRPFTKNVCLKNEAQEKLNWCKEDDKALDSILNDLRQGVIPDDDDINWLKSLKERASRH